MRFMIVRKADRDTEAGKLPSQELLDAMGAYNAELVKAGVWRGGDGLHPSREAVRVTFTEGEPSLTDGPFTETKELIAGFTLIEVAGWDEALHWVRRWPRIDGDGEVELELRRVYEASELGAE